MHENQPYPPSLSEFGKLRFGKKSDLSTCAKPTNTEQPNPPSFYDCKIFDGTLVVHALPSTTVSTFDSYAENVFISFILNHLQWSKRVDIVWRVVSKIRPERREVMVREETWPVKPRFLQIGTRFCGTIQARKNSLLSWQAELQTDSFPRTRK